MLIIMQNFITRLQDNVIYALTIALLAITSLLLLFYELSPWVNPEVVSLTQKIDLIIAIIFLTDFFSGLVFNNKLKTKEYFKQNWLNLVSSIPVTADAVRILRILRILRAFRVIRATVNLYFASSRLKRNRKVLKNK